EPFWLMNAGRKNDFTCKAWPAESYQAVVDALAGKIQFVQIGAAEHHHPPLAGVFDLRGKTDHRQLVRLMYHAAGVVTGVSYPMHLCAATPTADPARPLRPCVVVAGGREPAHWEQYPGHQFLHTIGQLPCCAAGGCWKARATPLKDGSHHDDSLCERPVDGHPACMRLIRPEDVVRAIERFLEMDGATATGLSELETATP
ncbi:MAG: glycosyltransferase family 9 protein, partial [Planctomycetia bacterium]